MIPAGSDTCMVFFCRTHATNTYPWIVPQVIRCSGWWGLSWIKDDYDPDDGSQYVFSSVEVKL